MTAAERCTAGSEVAQPLAADAFRAIFRRHPAGVAVITVADGETPVGFTATSVISVSAEPPVLAFSVAATSSAWPAIQRADSLVINFLAAEQVDLSARFATRGIDRFAGVDWSRLPTGEPVLAEVSSWIHGRIVSRTPVGSSFLIAVEAIESQQRAAGPPLVYHDRAYHSVGKHSAI